LIGSLTALHQLFGRSQYIINQEKHLAYPANQPYQHDLDIVVCTTGAWHLLDRVGVPRAFYTHQICDTEPMLLGFECHRVMRERLGQYDYYCYLEDDIILLDPWFFQSNRSPQTSCLIVYKRLRECRFFCGPRNLLVYKAEIKHRFALEKLSRTYVSTRSCTVPCRKTLRKTRESNWVCTGKSECLG
jgi:hypothetical protein